MTGNFDGLSIGTRDTVTVARTIGVGTRNDTKGRDEGRIDIPFDARERCRGSNDGKRQSAESTRNDHLKKFGVSDFSLIKKTTSVESVEKMR